MMFDEMFKEMQEDKIDASFISSPKYDGVYKWHKITDQLPPVGCYVLGYVDEADEKYFAIVRRVDTTEGMRFSNGRLFCTADILTHWMHLPNAPAQEDNDD